VNLGGAEVPTGSDLRKGGRTDVPALAGKPVQLYFKLKRAKLYAFQFTRE
jgi:hypothetical protein